MLKRWRLLKYIKNTLSNYMLSTRDSDLIIKHKLIKREKIKNVRKDIKNATLRKAQQRSCQEKTSSKPKKRVQATKINDNIYLQMFQYSKST